MLAIKAGQVFDGDRSLAAGSVVLVDGDRIAGVQAPESRLPAGCELTDFPGTTLLPGLIDTHVHLCCGSGVGALERIPTFTDEELTGVIETALRDHLAAGVTTVRDLGDRRWAVIDWRDRHRDDPAYPTVLGSGPPITIPDGHCWNMGGAAQGETELRRAVRDRVERHVDTVKIMASGGVNTPGTTASRPQFTVAELRTVVDEAHAGGLTVTAHAHALDAIRDALAVGVDALEHATFVTESGVQIDDDLVASMAESGIPVCPTLGVAPGVVPPPAILGFLRKAGITMDDRIRTTAELHRAGVRTVSGSDGGINPGKRHGILPDAVMKLVQGGMSAADALRSATSIAADAIGLCDRKGHLATGFDADLLLVHGDPLAEVAALKSVAAVYLRGRRLARA